MNSDDEKEWMMTPAPRDLPEVFAKGLLFPRRGNAATLLTDDLQAAVDDLKSWLDENPEHVATYGLAGAWMAYRVALQMATAHFTEPALHYFEIAVGLNPTAPDMQVNYAVALHSLGRDDEAIEHYEAALPLLDPVQDAHVFLLAATLLVRLGRKARARQVLSAIYPYPPEGEAFWDLWAEVAPESSATELPSLEQTCPQCGGEIEPASAFCRHCGAALAPPVQSCPKCGQTIQADGKFCAQCGASLVKS